MFRFWTLCSNSFAWDLVKRLEFPLVLTYWCLQNAMKLEFLRTSFNWSRKAIQQPLEQKVSFHMIHMEYRQRYNTVNGRWSGKDSLRKDLSLRDWPYYNNASLWCRSVPDNAWPPKHCIHSAYIYSNCWGDVSHLTTPQNLLKVRLNGLA